MFDVDGAVRSGPLTADDPPVDHPVLVRLQLRGTLRERVSRGVAWTAATRVLIQVITLGGQVVLARLLRPEDFGLVALVLVVNGFAALLTELGLTAAVVQARRLTDRLLSTAFWVGAMSGAVITAVVYAAAPLVAQFYGDPRVVLLLHVSSLVFVLNLSSVPMALLQRSLRFRTAGQLEVVGTITGMAATITFAALGMGAMSLVLGPLVQTVTMNLLLWATVRWVPRGLVRRQELAELWRFGGGLTGANLLGFISRNADTVLLGRTVSAAELGLYSRSYALMMMPLAQVSSVLSRVLLPAFAEMQGDPARLRRAWGTTVRTSLVVGLPVGLGVASTAPALVETLYGREWLGMVTTLVLLSASVPPQLLGRNLGPVFQALGRTGLQFRLALLTTLATLLAILVGLPWGIDGVALALFVKSWLALAIPLLPALRLIGMPAMDLWRASRGLLLAGGVLVVVTVTARCAAPASPAPIILLIQATAGAVGYSAVLWWVERDLVRGLLRRARRSGRGGRQ